MGYQCKNPFVCCLFIFIYILVSRSFPLPSVFLSTDIERGKYSPQEEDSNRNGLPPRPFNFQRLMYYLRRRAKERGE